MVEHAASNGATHVGDATRDPRSASPNGGAGRDYRPWERLSLGHLVMVAAGLVGVVATLAVLRGADATDSVAVAAHDIVPGDVVTADDFTFADVEVDDSVLDTLIASEELSEVEGRIAAQRVARGEFVPADGLVVEAAPNGLRAMSIPVDESRAVAGELVVGDRVDVLTVVDGEATYAVKTAEVLAVDRPSKGALGGGIEEFSVTVALDDLEALAVVAGIDSGAIVLARSTGASAPGVSGAGP